MAIGLSTDFVIEKSHTIRQQIDRCWNRTGAWQNYINAMRQTFPHQIDPGCQDLTVLRLAMLPGLCCEGAGGQFGWADPAAAAWLLFYNSAHIFDNIEDQDQLDPCWSTANPGVAINAACGLIFTAQLCLLDLYKVAANPDTATRLVEDFANTLLIMSSGQHQDLLEPFPGLESWFRVAGTKSGCFFALACRSGAQLATEDQEVISHYSEFGYQLGILMQLLDDVGDIIAFQQGEIPALPESLTRSLVVAYAMEVSPEETKQQLREGLASIAVDTNSAQEVLALLTQCGAGLYLATEIEKRRQFGLSALALAAPKNDAGVILTSILVELLDGLPADFLIK